MIIMAAWKRIYLSDHKKKIFQRKKKTTENINSASDLFLCGALEDLKLSFSRMTHCHHLAALYKT